MPSAKPPDQPRLCRFRTRMGSWWEWISRHWLSVGALVVGLVLGAVGLWSLAGAVWDLFELTLSQVMHSAVFGVGALLVVAGLAGFTRGRASPLVWLIAAAWAVAGVAVAIIVVTAWTVLGTPAWDPPATLTPQDLNSIATRAFAIVAGLGGVALLVIHYRRQRTTERGEQREIARLFTESFDIASAKLGENSAAVRLAGVHALARLADEAPEGREDLVQMVIDVLCAYLRMPYQPAPDPPPDDANEEQRTAFHERRLAYESFREVRHTIIRIIGNRLRASTHWRGKDYDFTGVVFDGGDFSGAWFSGETSFRGACFAAGQVLFEDAHLFVVDFAGAQFVDGKVSFRNALLATCRFERARFCGAEVVFDSARLNSWISFERARFESGDLSFFAAELDTLYFGSARFEGAAVAIISATLAEADFDRAWFTGPGGISFNHTVFTGTVSFDGALLNEGVLRFDESRWEGRWLSFSNASLDRTVLSFDGTNLLSGHLDFSNITFSHPENPPEVPAGLREAAASGEARVELPPQWSTGAPEQ